MSRKRIFSSAKAQVQFSIAFEELFENCIKAKQLFTFINMEGAELKGQGMVETNMKIRLSEMWRIFH